MSAETKPLPGGLYPALLAVKAEIRTLPKDAINPRDRHGNPLSDCPDCDGQKLKRAKRCKPCAARARTGTTRTTNPSNSTGWRRARALRSIRTCEYEGCTALGMDRHHIDDNPLNNVLSNIAVYCRRHHMMVDGRLAATAARAREAGKLGGRPRVSA